ncbi:hypothetical protein CRUP_025679 [Coryphaenoides rupestris]|nr:hypothetical protein CRUP_025679 [Coryphaenoides rupestris]
MMMMMRLPPVLLLLCLGGAAFSLAKPSFEWLKHGTCAATVESLDSQHKYFSKTLELYHKLDLDSVLKKFNITPSAEYYSFSPSISF